MYGASYLGIAKWAMAADAGPDLAAVVVAVASFDARSQTYHGDSFSLELALGCGISTSSTTSTAQCAAFWTCTRPLNGALRSPWSFKGRSLRSHTATG